MSDSAYWCEIRMDEELAEIAASRPPSPPADPPLREYSPLVRELMNLQDLIATHIAVTAHVDLNSVRPVRRPRTAIVKVTARKKKVGKNRMVDKLLPTKRVAGRKN